MENLCKTARRGTGNFVFGNPERGSTGKRKRMWRKKTAKDVENPKKRARKRLWRGVFHRSGGCGKTRESITKGIERKNGEETEGEEKSFPEESTGNRKEIHRNPEKGRKRKVRQQKEILSFSTVSAGTDNKDYYKNNHYIRYIAREKISKKLTAPAMKVFDGAFLRR